MSFVAKVGAVLQKLPQRDIFGGLHNESFPINVRMICLGASKHNFCMVIDENHAKEAIKRLHRKFIEL